jgi:hypothetical protein
MLYIQNAQRSSRNCQKGSCTSLIVIARLCGIIFNCSSLSKNCFHVHPLVVVCIAFTSSSRIRFVVMYARATPMKMPWTMPLKMVLSGRKVNNPMIRFAVIRFAVKNASTPPTIIPCTTSATMVLLNMMANILSRVSVKVAYNARLSCNLRRKLSART